ncbi:acyl-CoA dehydrogenase [Robiginitalea sp. SC105]|uniref:acyl-CoA dehydrogenase n=1 Tax=Robiginitalea sp. SC105 TaxID=2762332 RepID=UPI001639654C|nr:acyl-CoA dehydrogenase [Robiginitalea sp. SC105]MBC2838129.1 acyl-CoA dehydrogenase [Robiginitalea sp. SC105]
MTSGYLDMRTLKYLLYEVHGLEEVLRQPGYDQFDRASMELFLDAVRDFSDKELYPYFRETDAEPAHYADGEIRVHPQVGTYVRKGAELGLLSAHLDEAEGGMQLPGMVVTASNYIQDAANNHLMGYIGLIQGCTELLATYASSPLKATYIPPMIAGNWGGTMCLTEPQAGSSLSDITTAAEPSGDYYAISGQKIFISGGDYQGVENIVHLVLARIKGAPAGTKGISLFVVPKKRPGPDGKLQANDVTTVGDFQKMGQKGFSTAHLSFGDEGDCRGWLVGDPNKGLAYMFQMMNGARIGVGRGAAAITMAAYQASLAYAGERPQGRRLTRDGKKDLSQEQTLIINHPDVKRMLLLQKSVAEGSLSLVLLAARYQDLARSHPDEALRQNYQTLLDVLTPIAKTYPSEMGVVAVSNGLQVLGGYGFCSDFVLQQYYRDIRIYPIYEGTTGIQAQDLLGRKLAQDQGRAMDVLSGEISRSIALASEVPSLKTFAAQLKATLEDAQGVVKHLLAIARKGDFERFLADASIFMEYMGNMAVGWMWLDMAREARLALDREAPGYPGGFLEGKIHTMEYYFTYELPRTSGLREVLMNNLDITLKPPGTLFA